MSYNNFEFELFARQFILKEFSEESILKLKTLNIFIIGLGGIGCSLSQYLISSGVKNLTIVDGDKIEKSNLSRQILYTIDEIGKYKADVSKKKLLKTNPYSNITEHPININKNNLNLLSEASILIDTTDNWHTSKMINEYCVKKSICYIFSSAVGHDIQVALFPNRSIHHTCLNCIFPNQEDLELPRCETVGISSITAGIAGLLSAQKAINSLLNLNDEDNLLTLFDVIKGNFQNIKIKKNKDCLLNKS